MYTYIYIYITLSSRDFEARRASRWGRRAPESRLVLTSKMPLDSSKPESLNPFSRLISWTLAVRPNAGSPENRKPKSYPHPRLQVFPRWKKTPKTHRETKNSLAAGTGGWGQAAWLLVEASWGPEVLPPPPLTPSLRRAGNKRSPPVSRMLRVSIQPKKSSRRLLIFSKTLISTMIRSRRRSQIRTGLIGT